MISALFTGYHKDTSFILTFFIFTRILMFSLNVIVFVIYQELFFSLWILHGLLLHIPAGWFLRWYRLFVINLWVEWLMATRLIMLVMRREFLFGNCLLRGLCTASSDLLHHHILLFFCKRRLQVLDDCYRTFPFEVIATSLRLLFQITQLFFNMLILEVELLKLLMVFYLATTWKILRVLKVWEARRSRGGI